MRSPQKTKRVNMMRKIKKILMKIRSPRKVRKRIQKLKVKKYRRLFKNLEIVQTNTKRNLNPSKHSQSTETLSNKNQKRLHKVMIPKKNLKKMQKTKKVHRNSG